MKLEKVYIDNGVKLPRINLCEISDEEDEKLDLITNEFAKKNLKAHIFANGPQRAYVLIDDGKENTYLIIQEMFQSHLGISIGSFPIA